MRLLNYTKILTLAGSILFMTAANAMGLGEAKSSGLIGERSDGYLGIVDGNASAEVRQLVDSINSKRRAEYRRIASQNDISVNDVARMTAQKLAGRVAPGHYYQTAGGQWRRR